MSYKNIDADQRITHDVEKLTTDLSGLLTGMVKPSVDILWFTWRMKLLTGKRGVAILYAYMLLGLGFLRIVSPDFGDLASKEQQLEGTFRFMHSRLRTHAESIAFFGGGSREKAMVDSKFKELLDHSMKLLRKKWLYVILDDFVTKQLPHNVTWGLSLLYALEHKGDRALISTQETSPPTASKSSELDGIPIEDVISFIDVDIITPGQKLLAAKLTCDVVQGESLLLTGPNGSGKSSIFRILRGLWPIVSGRLLKPSQNLNKRLQSECGLFCVPQRPYTCLGTLKDQIIYPLSHEDVEEWMRRTGEKSDASRLVEAHLKSILENVRLVYLLEREGWDSTPNWEDILSLGEQQRLGMARLFFHHPKFGILDECTNATSVDIEEHLYKLAKEMGITFITSSQRPALIPFHSKELRLIDGEGSWELYSITSEYAS
ncbi:hypothetical protein HPP92_015488 [Vanilla planifolia]|uniref:ABC transporter domain-containing protein n=1 Tax=Vanilla planifolia TaxID=51239 RepID=A0A835QL91_VANPL|nr:hypothetical protein HPP92_015488 [Vanilla planifolia]